MSANGADYSSKTGTGGNAETMASKKLTNAERKECADLMADEIIRIINLFGYVLHLACVGSESKDEEHNSER